MTNAPAEISAPAWSNGLYSIKRHGTSLTTCESEPVQTPGCIQDHGVLLVLRLADLTILQGSDNTEQFFGEPIVALLGQSIGRVVGPEQQACLHNILQREALEGNVVYAFTMAPRAGEAALDVCIHLSGGVVVLEFEATRRQAGQDERDYFSLLRLAVGRLQTATGLRGFCDLVASEVRGMTALDRVMVYRFHADQHGEVFAESKQDDLPAWMGLHYPATDIPQQTRDMFKKSGSVRCRMLPVRWWRWCRWPIPTPARH